MYEFALAIRPYDTVAIVQPRQFTTRISQTKRPAAENPKTTILTLSQEQPHSTA